MMGEMGFAIATLLTLLCAAQAGAQGEDPKRDFTTALARVTAALEGRYGDDSVRLADGLTALERALAAWDQSIARTTTSIASELTSATPADSLRMRIALSLAFAERGQPEMALKQLEQATALAPRDVDVHTVLGLIHAQLTGNTLAATSAFRTAVAGDPAAPLQRYLLAKQLADHGELEEAATVAQPLRADTRRADDPDRAPFLRLHLLPETAGLEPYFPIARYLKPFVALAQGRYSDGVDALRAAVADDVVASPPPAAMPAVADAGTALRDGDTATALAALDRAAKAAPGFDDIHRLRGIVLAAGERFDQAESAFKEALRLLPTHERTHLALAEVLTAQDKHDEAAATLTRALATIPGSPRLHHALGRVLQLQGLYPQAVMELERSLAIAPPLPLLGLNSVHATIAALRRAQQEFPEATAAFAKRVDLVPNSVEAHRELADIYFRQALDDLAWTELAIAEAVAPRDVATQALLAQLHLRAGRHAEAIASARRVIALDAAHAQAHYVLGTALMRSNEMEDGARALETFRRLDAAETAARKTELELNALRREAIVSAAQGDDAKAVSLLSEIVERDAKSASARVELGVALIKAGRPSEAVEQLQAAAGLGATGAVYGHLADAYSALGDTVQSARAREVYERIRRERLRRQAERQ
jgi:tetratricopeptide (TPR) repeat protein